MSMDRTLPIQHPTRDRFERARRAAALAPVIALAAVLWIGAAPPEPRSVAPEATLALVQTDVVLHGADDRWESEIDWAVERFESANLDPVDVTVHVWDDADASSCLGHSAVFKTSEPGTNRIDVCIPYFDGDIGTDVRRKVLLHELSHAWIDQYVGADARQAFMDMRGRTTWNDPDVPHYARGTEHAANAIMWTLHGSVAADDERVAGYDLLTAVAA